MLGVAYRHGPDCRYDLARASLDASLRASREIGFRQGELIGRVGSSGLATAAHLDYRLKSHGTFINPVTAHRAMPPAAPIPAPQMAAFEAARDLAMAAFAPPAVVSH